MQSTKVANFPFFSGFAIHRVSKVEIETCKTNLIYIGGAFKPSIQFEQM